MTSEHSATPHLNLLETRASPNGHLLNAAQRLQEAAPIELQ
jgi:hypothetical protein